MCVLQVVLSSVHAVKGLECVVGFVVGLDTKAWRYLPYATTGPDLQQASPDASSCMPSGRVPVIRRLDLLMAVNTYQRGLLPTGGAHKAACCPLVVPTRLLAAHWWCPLAVPSGRLAAHYVV